MCLKTDAVGREKDGKASSDRWPPFWLRLYGQLISASEARIPPWRWGMSVATGRVVGTGDGGVLSVAPDLCHPKIFLNPSLDSLFRSLLSVSSRKGTLST